MKSIEKIEEISENDSQIKEQSLSNNLKSLSPKANEGIINLIENNSSPSTDSQKENDNSLSNKQTILALQKYNKLYKKYRQRVWKVQKTKKPISWIEIHQNFALYIEDDQNNQI